MTSLADRLRLMVEVPRRRQRGQILMAQVDAARNRQAENQQELNDHQLEVFDCSESLKMLRIGNREALERRQMMWEDHYANQLRTEQSRSMAARQRKLKQETAMLTQVLSDTDRWNMAIQLRLLVYIDASLSIAPEDVKKAYFCSYNEAGLPPLHRACGTNDMQLVKLLLKLGADVTYKDSTKKSVFHMMAKSRATEMFQALTAMVTNDAKEILQSLDNNGHSPMHVAASNGSDGILKELLTGSCREDMKTQVDLMTLDTKRTALHLAALHGNCKCVELLLTLASATVNLRDAEGSTALHLALRQTFDIDKLTSVFLLYTPFDQLDATLGSFDEANGQTCLHTAVIKNFRRVAIAIIQSGKAPIDAATIDGKWTPLHLAVITEEIDVIQELLAADAALDAVDADGQTPLLQACLGGQLQIVRLLLNAAANPCHQNKQAHSPLHYLAAFCRDRPLLQDIVAKGADVNVKSMKLNTPLHFAAMNGNDVATQVLLEHGASINAINDDRRSVVYLAKKWRHRSVENLVRQLNQQDGDDDVHKVIPPAPRQKYFARTSPHDHPRTPVFEISRFKGFDSDPLYDLEDDESILVASSPWPITVDHVATKCSGSSNEDVNLEPSMTKRCSSFRELRKRFMGKRSPLKPVVLAHDRHKSVMDKRVSSRAERSPFTVNSTSRHLVGPVCIPWEMTVPVPTSSGLTGHSNQRKLNANIRTNISVLQDNLAHTRRHGFQKLNQ